MVQRHMLLLALAGTSHALCNDYDSESTCRSDAACVWSPQWYPGLCTEDPCRGRLGETSCLSSDVAMPVPCINPPGDDDFCDVDACTYNPMLAAPCQIRHCMYFDEASCTGDRAGNCEWHAPSNVDLSSKPMSERMAYCAENNCAGLSRSVCEQTNGCQYTSSCEHTTCGEYSDELSCDRDKRCHWDVSKGFCKDTECAQYGASECHGKGGCMLDGAVCVPKTCNKYNNPPDRCACSHDSDCKWHLNAPNSYCVDPAFDACPDLDVAFILDGSGSMKRSFGRHKHGFYGLMEIMRDWMKTVPLTGDDHTMGASITSKGKGFRITFIQFSKRDADPDEDHPMGCKVGECTDGLLSGNRDELQGDIEWHEDNYQRRWTYLNAALMDVADHTFLPSQSPSWRQHVAIIIADGGLTDYDGDSCTGGCGRGRDRKWRAKYKNRLLAAQEKLREEDVTVFGVVIRRFDYHSFQDENAAVKLKPLLTEPADDHFLNLMLDEVPSELLNKLCDPNSKFGKQLTRATSAGCTSKVEADCKAAAVCQWDSLRMRCEDSVCFPLCTQEECNAKSAVCVWNGDRCDPKVSGCTALTTQSACANDATCIWDPMWSKGSCTENPCIRIDDQNTCVAHIQTMPACTPPLDDPDYCDVQVCHHDPVDRCQVQECLEDTEGRCSTKTSCQWLAPNQSPTAAPSTLVALCAEKQCQHASQADCGKDDACKWDGKTCVETECAKLRNEKDCDHNPKCHMDLTKDPQVCVTTECAKHDSQDPCDTDAKCMWTKVNNVDVCVPKTCEKHTTKCPCDKDADCKWHHGPSGSYCASSSFSNCPDADVAFILDGSGSMKRSFGRHKHGFYGLMEIMRDWMKTVPLTGDDHTVGASTKKDAGFRITFIQFSKRDADADEYHPMGCKVGECTDGLLSGNRDELQGDIEWHEDNYQKSWTYLNAALMDVADHTFLPSQSPSWRQHVAIIIADGGLTDYDGDSCTGGCGKKKDKRWKSKYYDRLLAAQEKLREEDVTVFGVVIRRFDYHSFQDENAAVKLKPLLTEPADDHFLNLMLDEVSSELLNKLCDPGSKLGHALVTKGPDCGGYSAEDECKTDKACVWDSDVSPAQCKESVCYPLCDETTCNGDKSKACQWNGKMCEYIPGCDAKPQADCENDPTCLWDPVWSKGSCTDNPCVDNKDEDSCRAVGVTMPLPCAAPPGDPDYCKLDVCDYHKPGTCEVKKCLEDTEGRCSTKTSCQWLAPNQSPTAAPSTLVALCAEKQCQHASQADCGKDDACKWDGKTCVETECAKLRNEKDCDHNLKCHMDLTKDPQVCVTTECAKHDSQDPCDNDAKCMWTKVNNVDVCVPKTCEKHTTKCPCDLDTDCKWHHGQGSASCVDKNYDTCADLDVAFILDGSGSMKRSFGRHKHGFYGLMEIMRDWMKTVPLTGDDHTMGASITSKGKGFRITFIQFSKRDADADEYHPMGCKVGECTDGLLSGNRDELQGDIEWHEDNYQKKWTYLNAALMDVADHTFLPSQSPSWRQHVAIIIADGGLTDYDGDSCTGGCGKKKDKRWKSKYYDRLLAAQEKLREEDVTVFGVVIRRFDYHSFQDENAAVKLKPLLTEPADDHFLNLMLDEVSSELLNKLCDPGSKLGHALVTKGPDCGGYSAEDECKTDKACVWDSDVSPAQCKESVCYPLCDETTCNGDKSKACQWNGKMCEYIPGCDAKPQADCENDPTCLWDPVWSKGSCTDNPCVDNKDEDSCRAVGVTMPLPCAAPPGDPDYCKLDVCDYHKPGTCEVKKCLEDTEGRCSTKTSCQWLAPNQSPTAAPSTLVALCAEKQCQHASQADCGKDDACKWDGKTCVETECAKLRNEKDCDHNLKCHMDLTKDPQVCVTTECAKHDSQDPCDNDAKCMWTKVNNVDVCVPKTCEKHTTKCPCDLDTDCKWHHGQGSASCVDKNYDTCADLDVAFILDGSGSMKRSFGRHKHGFYGLMEIMRDWMKTVPLTGDDHTMGASITSKGKGFRITFIQFSKRDADADEYHPMGCKVGECTDGLLSGNRDELQGDIEWHEDNYQKKWTYLNAALMDVADHTFLPSQSPSWRQHVAIIIADGGLTDYDGDSCTGGCGKKKDKRWKPEYRDRLLAAQEKLREEDVTVFGVVIRRFDYHSFQDENAAVKLKPLLTEPADDHFLNLMLDEVSSELLNKLCDHNSKFGKALVGNIGCHQYDNEQDCGLDHACDWDQAASGCVESQCYVNCKEVTCLQDAACTWSTSGNVCKTKQTCDDKAQDDCKNDPLCLRDPVWSKGSCTANPCQDQNDKDSCQGTSVTMPLPCAPLAADPDYCKIDVCVYGADEKCTVEKCLEDSQTRCEIKTDCVWHPTVSPTPSGPPSQLVGFCDKKQCQHASQADCGKDDACKWDGKTCVETECATLRNEKDCDHNPKCHMDLTKDPQVCVTTECAKHDSQDPCDNDAKCMWTKVNNVDVCVPKTCEKHGKRCDCQSDPDCVWHHDPNRVYCTSPHFDACPDIDLAIMIDGSGSMKAHFGSHKHGFYGLIEMMRDWLKGVPLTGHDHTVGADVPITAKGFRVTFIQFSEADVQDDTNHPVNCNVGACTDGLLSGRRDELFGDLDWQEDNYQAGWTYLHVALNDVADNAFLPSKSPSWRTHVALVIVDGGLVDYNGDPCTSGCGKATDKNWQARYQEALLEAQQKLREEDVRVFGVAVRRFTRVTDSDENAEAKLTPLVSDPRDQHFVSVELDNLKEQVLDSLCEKTSKFGSQLAVTLATCTDYGVQADCEKDTGCIWDTTCKKSECYDLCTTYTCKTNPKCMWKADECLLAPATPAPPTPAPGTLAPPTPLPETPAPPTPAPPTSAPPTPAPPTPAPLTHAPPTPEPTPVPTPEPPVDECALPDNKAKCEKAGQTCVDPDQKADNNWKCVCQPPSTNFAVGAAAQDCDYDECSLHSSTCTHVGQTCVDKEKTKPNSWECECVPPQTGAPGTTQPAACKDPPGDCTTNGAVCHSAGQVCKTGATKFDGKVECECTPPSTGTVGANKAAECKLDECAVVCPTCAQTDPAGANVCTAAGQDCEDLNTDAQHLRDWRCKCRDPYTGLKMLAAAVCELDECKKQCPTCADKDGQGNMCEKAGQTCVEKSVTALSDWECHCVDPKVGMALTAVADCTEDECRTREQVCVAAGQTCVDPDDKVVGDWKCVCAPPSATTAVGGAAVCELEECTQEEVEKVCKDSHQKCVDPDVKVKGNWECHCVKPAHGTAVKHAVPECALDECVEKCPTCADKDDGKGNLCTVAGQVCEDPLPTHHTLNDWLCKCPAPSTKTSVTSAVPECREGRDECVERSGAVQCKHTPRYSEDGCMCLCGWNATFKDADGKVVVLKGPGGGSEPCTDGCCNPTNERADWCYIDQGHEYNKNKLHCVGANVKQYCVSAGQVPQDGGAAPRPVIPGVPNGQNNVCTDVHQKCVDPDDMTDDDWMCECVLPQAGPNGMQQPAVCENDECVVHGAVCTQAGQVCFDTDKTTNDTWQCNCTVGPTLTQPQGAADCKVDECIETCPTCAVENGTNACTAAGQVCADGNTSQSSLGDWTCTCPPPSTGSAVGGPAAMCELDECVLKCPTCADKDDGKGNTCEKAGQACEDPDKLPSVTGNWRCVCKPPSHTTAVANVAECETDECEGKTCELGQLCYDPNLQQDNDWRCECVAPAVGSAVKGNATCEEDECKEHGTVCMNAGQECEDTDKTTFNNWICKCIAPDKGLPAAQQPADCKPPKECENNYVCVNAGQHCTDPSPALNDWECHCVAPYSSTTKGVMQTADCTLDECADVCTTCAKQTATSVSVCEMHGQNCVDSDQRKLSDWRCECIAPATGVPSTGAAAICNLDECVAACDTCADKTCSSKGQMCEDMSTDPKHVRDWVCKCAPPSTNTKTAAAVDKCMYDECVGPNATMCTGANQTCVDPDQTVAGDWECRCPPPSSGSAVQGATDKCVLNECTVKCPTCADKDDGKGNTCTAQEQRCVDPDHTNGGDWYCECAVGTGISVGSAVPQCVLDECKVQCPTCADTGGGNLCVKEGQTCRDRSTDARSTSDWECRCPPPFEERHALTALAVCSADECVEAVNGTVNGAVCTAAGQLCHDSHVDTLHDFDCVCPPPKHGTRTGSAAECTKDECLIHGDVCTSANQTCYDPDTTHDNDWECVCAAPSTTVKLVGVAVCEVDECEANRKTCEGAQPPQACVDANRTQAGDWECRCQAPSSGTAVAAAAECMLDECEVTCATCEKDVCKKAEQTCTDPNPSFLSLNDWQCVCPPPSTTMAVAQAAECEVDECVVHGHVCQTANQKCLDPDHAAKSLGDWECECVAPATGRAIAQAAECEVDECTKHGHVCTGHSQTCVDLDKKESSTGDWECLCVPPAPQKAVGAAAECVHVGECDDPLVATICESRGQVCEDPDETVLDDWRCLCTPPSRGAPVVAGAAQCVLDECTDTCSTCAKGACTAANQLCVDENTNPLTGLNSWECRCVAPLSGSKVGGHALCVVNECELHGSTCTAAEQDCVDPDNAVMGDWQCECRKPAVGKATAAAAQCQTDECSFHEKTCTDVGQVCEDPDRSSKSLGDWTCTCIAPWGGSAVAKEAECTLDECDLYGDVCTSVGQTCTDPELGLKGHWKCVCPPPNERVGRTGGPALCEVDECVVPGNQSAVAAAGEQDVCAKAGQTCSDPDLSPLSKGDWSCTCAPPSNRTAIAHVAVCEVDECHESAKASVCTAARQACVDKDWLKEGDWVCECVAPSVGTGQQQAAVCLTDECKTSGSVCQDEGQLCKDTDLTEMGSWACECVPGHGVDGRSQTGGAADCNPPSSECKIDAIRKVCTEAKQACFDPDVQNSNDWGCECVPPATGASKQGEPTVCVLDECAHDCPTCGKSVCAAEEQRCVDENTDASSLGDWRCECVGEARGWKKGGVAACTLNECTKACADCPGTTCSRAGTECVDPNTDVRSVGDWECVCRAPSTGRMTQGVPSCMIDECVKHATECGPGQTCADPNQLASAEGDWRCTCALPTSGVAVAGPATCTVDECMEDVNVQTCRGAGQTCEDMDMSPESKGDWRCVCPQGGTSAVAAAAKCVLDECTERCPTCADSGGGSVCVQNEQTCVDPNTSPLSTRDWMCTCPQGAPSATAAAAVCNVDECSEPSNFGAHTCEHTPRVTVDGCDCECGWQIVAADRAQYPRGLFGPGADVKCMAGCCNPDMREGGAWCVVAGGSGAKCVKGSTQKCTLPPAAPTVVNVCTQAGQTCLDPDTRVASTGDWRCACRAPMSGEVHRGGPAVCLVDECQTHGEKCTKVGQKCVDPNTQTEGDWKCDCVAPAQGSSIAGVATCTYVGECERPGVADVCTQLGQACYDPDVKVDGNWVCRCVDPARGEAVAGGPAVCHLDECAEECPSCADVGFGNVCEDAGQRCAEGSTSPSSLRDWKCVCPADQVGEALAAAAECRVDECLANNGRLALLCGAAKQTCVDADTRAVGGLGNWQCVCPPPSIGKATGHVASCLLDECQTSEVASVCTAAGQECEDPNTDALSRDDWRCKCVTKPGEVPQMKVGGVAKCLLPPTSWCVKNGEKCTAHGQACVPAEGNIAAEGTCRCIAPLQGADVVGATAVCILDECTTQCETCADHGSGNVCKKAGQECVEGSTNPSIGKGDWRCKCKDSDSFAVAAVATCTLNECDGDAGRVCTAAEQVCHDPDLSPESVGDWECVCHSPQVGRKLAGAAMCVYDECIRMDKTCTSVGQTCHDTNTAADSRGDWECRCPSPATGSAVAEAAECAYVGDCEKAENAAVCSKAGQSCFDPDVAVEGNWECRCVAPQTGVAKQGVPAACMLDECRATCSSCATPLGSQTHACVAAEQECVDPDTSASSTEDWKCVCVLPAEGEQVGAAAKCTVNECSFQSNRATCAAVTDVDGKPVQHCVDPDMSTMGDWICDCMYPYTGTPGHREASVCTVDECSAPEVWSPNGVNGDEVCATKGQTCLDPQQGVESKLGNWVCQCADGVGEPMVGAPAASCKTQTLCQEHSATCGAHQMCVEDAEKQTWGCKCVSPMTGEASEAAAVCVLDECVATCTTCAQRGSTHTCTAAGQRCVDHDRSPDSRGDWSCVCEEGTGEAAAHVAECMVDECALNAVTCQAKGQVCVDRDTDVKSRGDWVCQCVEPAAGEAVAGQATCVVDECNVYGETCTRAGQICKDENTAEASKNDWTCSCPPPSKGMMYAGIATCEYESGCADESKRRMCTDAGQMCLPGDDLTSEGDFKCACAPPFRGEAGVRGPASCVVNECDDICATCARTNVEDTNACTAAGQRCVDPNTDATSPRDWVCMCAAPATAAAVGHAVESCNVDECAAVTLTSARKCQHFKRYTVKECECACGWLLKDLDGNGPGVSEECTTGCCNPTHAPEGDWCVVADTPYNRQNEACLASINQQQTCTSERTPRPAGAAIPAYKNICEEAGQICVDPNNSPAVLGDWECRCTTSEEKHIYGPASCNIDECKTSTACFDAGQSCVDKNTSATSLGDWECQCLSGFGSKNGAPADCEREDKDECNDEKNRQACPDGQYCYDEDPELPDTWECKCMAPFVEKAAGSMQAATCVIDECSVVCTTCARKGDGHGYACEGQLCVDPSGEKTGDWKCECVAPALGSTTAARAVCVLDECLDSKVEATCTAEGQDCVDPDTSDAALNDWTCQCRRPTTGSALRHAAACLVDECAVESNLKMCHKAGQMCHDPDTTSKSLKDWICRCPSPATGSAVGAPAHCKFVGECGDPDVLAVCTNVEQTCVDTDVAKDGTWMCTCVAPQTGVNGLMGPATCGINECTADCPTCEKGLCAQAGQECHDPSVETENDWVCRCKAPQEGAEGQQAAAVCTGVVCAVVTDPLTCAREAECVYDKMIGLCTNVGYGGGVINTTTLTLYDEFRVAAPGDDDCGFWECWWWILLLLLLCCCLLLAFLLFRWKQKQNQNEEDDEKWNKQFEAQVDQSDDVYSDDDI